MKKAALLVVLLIGLIGTMLVIGCSNEATTGDPTDPEFETFTSIFDYVNGATGELIGAPFLFIDSIAQQGGNPAPATFKVLSPAATQITLTWIAETSFWYCTAEVTEPDVSLWYTDSIQFKHGSTPVQYFHDDSLTQIISYASLSAIGTGIDTAWGRQTQTITRNLDNLTVSIGGSGTSAATLSQDSCTVDWNYSQSFNNLTWSDGNLFNDQTGELNCPYQGSIAHEGSLNGSCQGLETSISGSWGVTATFNNGMITYQITNGNTQWSSTEQCYSGVN